MTAPPERSKKVLLETMMSCEAPSAPRASVTPGNLSEQIYKSQAAGGLRRGLTDSTEMAEGAADDSHVRAPRHGDIDRRFTFLAVRYRLTLVARLRIDISFRTACVEPCSVGEVYALPPHVLRGGLQPQAINQQKVHTPRRPRAAGGRRVYLPESQAPAGWRSSPWPRG